MTEEQDEDESVSTYEPLSKDEIRDLVTQARDAKHYGGDRAYQKMTQIQVRLNKGVPGIVTPHEIEGPVAERCTVLNHTYMKWVKNVGADADVEEIAATLDEIINQDSDEQIHEKIEAIWAENE